MALSKKHYEQFAYHFINSTAKIDSETGAGVSPAAAQYAKQQLENLAKKMAVDFSLDNPNFKRAVFMKACGF